MKLPLDQQNIINILGIQSLPEEQKLALVEKISELVQKRLLLRVLDSLSLEKREAFEQLLTSNNQAGLEQFLQTDVPQFAVWFEEELKKIKEEMSALTIH